jgi:hypothetical protein
MSSYDGDSLFDSGPHALRFGPWQRSMQRRGFAGVNGELLLDLGLRSRKLTQTGRLQGESPLALHAQLEAISAHSDGATHTLVDNYGQQHPDVILERFETTTPVQRGRGFYCDYLIEYLQLPWTRH